MPNDVPVQHGPEEVCYSNHPVYGLRPFLRCLCGWSGCERTWRELGEEFDDHLLEVTPVEGG